MFSYALRQIQPRSVSPSRARLPVTVRRWFLGFVLGGKNTLYSLIKRGSRPLGAILSLRTRARAENARPSLTGQERSGPAGRSVVTIIIIIFFFCWQTARQLVFCLSIFISAVTSVLLLLVPVLCIRMRVPVYNTCPRVKCLCPRVDRMVVWGWR